MNNASPKPPNEKNLRAAFAIVIEQCRNERAMSQEKLAELADLSVSYISLLERGQRNLTVYSAAKVAASFGMETSKLVQCAEEKLRRQRTLS